MKVPLSNGENLIFTRLCEYAVKNNCLNNLCCAKIYDMLIESEIHISKMRFHEILLELERKRYLSRDKGKMRLNTNAFDLYLKNNIEEFNNYIELVSSALTRLAPWDSNNHKLAEQLDIPEVYIDHILYILNRRNQVKLQRKEDKLTYTVVRPAEDSQALYV